MHNGEKEKVILKTESFPGVDLSVLDLHLMSSVKLKVTKLTKPIFKVGKQTFIGVKDPLDSRDVIQVGDLGLKYRVIKLKEKSDQYWNIYRIKRYDGAFTTSLDMDATKAGQKVFILNRQTYEEIFAYACSERQENPVPKTTCENQPLPCESCEDFENRTE